MYSLVGEENKVTSNVGCVSNISSFNFHWTAEFALKEDSAVVSRFERARSHDVNDPTHLINSDFKYLQQNDIIVLMDESVESD